MRSVSKFFLPNYLIIFVTPQKRYGIIYIFFPEYQGLPSVSKVHKRRKKNQGYKNPYNSLSTRSLSSDATSDREYFRFKHEVAELALGSTRWSITVNGCPVASGSTEFRRCGGPVPSEEGYFYTYCSVTKVQPYFACCGVHWHKRTTVQEHPCYVTPHCVLDNGRR